MRKAFTLVELMVVLAVFGTITVVATRILLQVIQDSSKATVQNNLRQIADKIMADIGSEVRRSGCVKIPPSIGGSQLLTYKKPSPTNASECDLTNRLVTYTYNRTTGSLSKTLEDGTTVINFLPPGVIASNCGRCDVACTPPLRGFFASPEGTDFPIPVTVTLKLQPGAIVKPELCGFVTLEDTFIPRN